MLTFPIISQQIGTAASLSVVQSSKKHKDPPTRREMSTTHEYVAVFTTAQNILFSTREPRPRGAWDAPQHIAAPPPFTPRSSCLQEAAGGRTPHTSDLSTLTHLIYVFLGSTVSTATLLLQARTTAWQLIARPQQNKQHHFFKITVQITGGLLDTLAFGWKINKVKMKTAESLSPATLRYKPAAIGNSTETQ